MDHPPSTPASSRPARRALLTTAAALSAIVAPVGLVASLAGDTGGGLDAKPIAATAEVESQNVGPAVRFAAQSELERLQSLILPAPPTTVPAAPPTTAAPAPTTTVPPVAAAPAPAPAATSSDDGVWDRLAQCESGGNWSINTGNGYYGGLQFSARTWRSVGGTGLPHEHSRETQIEMGKRLQARAGWGQWPSCSRRLGLR